MAESRRHLAEHGDRRGRRPASERDDGARAQRTEFVVASALAIPVAPALAVVVAVVVVTLVAIVVVLVVVLVVAVVVVVSLDGLGALSTAIGVLVLLAPAAVIDRRIGRLPDVFVGMAAAVVMLSIAVRSIEVGQGPWTETSTRDVVAGAVMCTLPALVMHLARPDALGFGDVKAIAVLGAALGGLHPVVALAAVSAASGGTAAVGVLSGRRRMPLGPGLVVAGSFGVIVAIAAGVPGARP